jgi:hypothetical protein
MPKGVYEHKSIPAVERFWKKVDRKGDSDCWTWTGAKCKKGYGRFADDDGSKTLVHRFSLELALGRKLLDGLNALHSCDNPSCVNPSHLREGTQEENMRDAIERNRKAIFRGTDSSNSKLSDSDVIEIRKMYSDGSMSQYGMAKKFNVSQSVIHAIVHKRKWAHI